ncbi:cation:proton antiporter [Spirillospora sp. NPDC029432]|uniref:cation:proton antiporter n=1 Tax=Spirillospora sp. NPDC029432 TaxID=3154599 RepID=UPI0034563A6E
MPAPSSAPAGVVPPLASHELLVFLLQIGVLLALALLLGRLAARFGLPAVVGELCAGVLAGPSLLGWAAPDLAAWLLPQDAGQMHLLDAAAQIGVLLLVALTAIEIDLGLLRRNRVTALRVSAAGLVVPLALGVAVGYVLPAALLPGEGAAERTVPALFLGVAMCVSALPVIAKTLMDMNLVHRDIGQLILTAGVLDDIAGWFLLSLVSALAIGGFTAAGAAASLLSLAAVAVAALLARPLVRAVLRAAGRSTPAVTLAAVVALTFLAAAATQALELEAILGAFVCGLLIKAAGNVELARIAPLRTLVLAVFAPLFFATAGLRMDLTALARPDVLALAPLILLIAIAGKFLGAYLGATLSRLDRWEALALAGGMNARGVIEVIVAMVGLRLGVITPAMYTIIVLVAIVTSLMAPPVLRMAVPRIELKSEEELRLMSDTRIPS